MFHCDADIALIHHCVPALVHRELLAPCWRVAHSVPRNIPEVAEVESCSAWFSFAGDCMATSGKMASSIDLGKGTHLKNHDVIIGRLQCGDVALFVHKDNSRAFRLRCKGAIRLVCVHFLVNDCHKVGVDVPRKPIIPNIALVTGNGRIINFLLLFWSIINGGRL